MTLQSKPSIEAFTMKPVLEEKTVIVVDLGEFHPRTFYYDR